jgi:hypothetical protein
MPKVSDTFGGAYWKGEAFANQPRVFEIDGISTETVYGEECFVLYFRGEKRGLKLSATCARDIAGLYGDEMDHWSGRFVELYGEKRTITDRDSGSEKQVTMTRARAPAEIKLPERVPAPDYPDYPSYPDDPA